MISLTSVSDHLAFALNALIPKVPYTTISERDRQVKYVAVILLNNAIFMGCQVKSVLSIPKFITKFLIHILKTRNGKPELPFPVIVQID